jgi:hypothetical protein
MLGSRGDPSAEVCRTYFGPGLTPARDVGPTWIGRDPSEEHVDDRARSNDASDELRSPASDAMPHRPVVLRTTRRRSHDGQRFSTDA